MHLKAIPAEASALLGNKTFLYGAAALAAVGVVYYSHSRAASKQADAATGVVPSYSAPVAAPGLAAIPSSGSTAQGGGIGGATGEGGSVANPNPPSNTTAPGTVSFDPSSWNNFQKAITDNVNKQISQGVSAGINSWEQAHPFPQPQGIDPAAAEILAQQRRQQEMDYSLQLANLQLQNEIVNSNVYMAQINNQTAQYQAAGSLAQSFLYSNDQLFTGGVYGPDGHLLLDAAFIQARDTKGNGWNQDLQGLINRGTLDQFYTQTGLPSNNTPLPPAGYGAPPVNAGLGSVTPNPSAQTQAGTQPTWTYGGGFNVQDFALGYVPTNYNIAAYSPTPVANTPTVTQTAPQQTATAPQPVTAPTAPTTSPVPSTSMIPADVIAAIQKSIGGSFGGAQIV